MICFVLFRNGHFHKVISTFTNNVHINVENDNVVSTLSNVFYINVDSTLFDVVNSKVEIHNVASTLIWRCPTSRRRINQKTTLKQRWGSNYHLIDWWCDTSFCLFAWWFDSSFFVTAIWDGKPVDSNSHGLSPRITSEPTKVFSNTSAFLWSLRNF